MNIRQFIYKVGEALVLEAALVDDDLKNDYLAWAKKKWPRLALLEELLDELSRQKFYRQCVWEKIETHVQEAIAKGGNHPRLLEEPASVYFEVIFGESHGLTSSTIGEMKKTVVPRLIQKVKATQVESSEIPPWDIIADEIGIEIAEIVKQIFLIRRDLTDRVSVKLFT